MIELILTEYWYLVGLLVLVGLYQALKPKIKGRIGELTVSFILSFLDKDKNIILNDVMIPDNKGGTTQIDHIIISVYGIYVLETKNYIGWILGNEKSTYWTQVIYKRKEKLYNPILQNKGHVSALKKLLEDYNEMPFYPIVVFTGNSDLKLEVESDVIYTWGLLKKIKQYQNNEVLKLHEINKIAESINSSNIVDKKDRKEHVRNIHKKEGLSNDICPFCGGELVNRKGKYGYFKGCSNYPRCKYILKK